MNTEQLKALNDYQKASLEQNTEKRKKRKKIFLVILVIYTILLFLTKVVGLEFVIAPNRKLISKGYEVTLNNHSFEIFGRGKLKVPIIPFVFYYERLTDLNFWEEPKSFTYSTSDVLKLDIESYNCYHSGIQIDCKSFKSDNKNIVKEEKKAKYNLKIYKHIEYNIKMSSLTYFNNSAYRNAEETKEYYESIKNNKFEIIYDGKYISDITSYIEQEGVYGLVILRKNKFTTDTLKMGFINNGKEILLINRNG